MVDFVNQVKIRSLDKHIIVHTYLEYGTEMYYFFIRLYHVDVVANITS